MACRLVGCPNEHGWKRNVVGYRVDPTVRVVRVSQQGQVNGRAAVEVEFRLSAFSCLDNAGEWMDLAPIAPADIDGCQGVEDGPLRSSHRHVVESEYSGATVEDSSQRPSVQSFLRRPNQLHLERMRGRSRWWNDVWIYGYSMVITRLVACCVGPIP